MKKTTLILFIFVTCFVIKANVFKSEIPFEEEEYWWGGVVAWGAQMPFLKPVSTYDLSSQSDGNQTVPLLLSNKGRYIWSEHPFRFSIENNVLFLESEYEKPEAKQGGKTLKEAYLAASKKHFPSSGLLPDPLFFTMPQYNTWIELMYNQNQEDILQYARQIIKHDFPKGILMIDDNWQKYYGNFEFKPDKFADPKDMVTQLHSLGFKVMLWVCPFVSPDSPEYRNLSAKGYLLKQKNQNKPAIIDWWNGQSACYDFTNPDAFNYFVEELKKLQNTYGIDGYKFDAGDVGFYNTLLIDSYDRNATALDHTLAWAKIGTLFSFNEYRACWKMGGQALVQRLGDKVYSWESLKLLIPGMTAAGLLGHAYTCPDMIGGGEFNSFLNIKESEFDQALIIRSAQIHALMPMMQFSVAPWRILNEQNLSITRSAALLHEKMGTYILDCAKAAAKSGEPIVRSMEYAFPNEGYETCIDQFMLGDEILIAPIITFDNKRMVKLPKGKWKDDLGKTHKGGNTISFEVPLDRVLYFEKQK